MVLFMILKHVQQTFSFNLLTPTGKKYMGIKLLWTGLTITLASPIFTKNSAFVIAGLIIMAIGCVVMWLDK